MAVPAPAPAAEVSLSPSFSVSLALAASASAPQAPTVARSCATWARAAPHLRAFSLSLSLSLSQLSLSRARNVCRWLTFPSGSVTLTPPFGGVLKHAPTRVPAGRSEGAPDDPTHSGPAPPGSRSSARWPVQSESPLVLICSSCDLKKFQGRQKACSLRRVGDYPT